MSGAKIPTMVCPECAGLWQWAEHEPGCGSHGECCCGGMEVNCPACDEGSVTRPPLTALQVGKLPWYARCIVDSGGSRPIMVDGARARNLFRSAQRVGVACRVWLADNEVPA